MTYIVLNVALDVSVDFCSAVLVCSCLYPTSIPDNGMSLGIDDNNEGADIWWNTTASAKDYFLSDSLAPNQTQAVSVVHVCVCV